MPLVVVSYPSALQRASGWVESIRQQYTDLNHSVLPPHFTFVFPLRDVEQAALVAHLETITRNYPPIPFALRSSILLNDDTNANMYVVLTPDEGFSGIVKLHDKLYTGFLAERLRLDIPFIPHVTIGYSTDIHLCKRAVDDLNGQSFEITDVIDTLDLVSIEGSTTNTITQLPLGNTKNSDT